MSDTDCVSGPIGVFVERCIDGVVERRTDKIVTRLQLDCDERYAKIPFEL